MYLRIACLILMTAMIGNENYRPFKLYSYVLLQVLYRFKIIFEVNPYSLFPQSVYLKIEKEITMTPRMSDPSF